MIGQNIRDLVPTFDFGLPHPRSCAVGTDHQFTGQFFLCARCLLTINHAGAVRVAYNSHESAHDILGPGVRRPGAQERIKILAINHADKPVFDGDINTPPGWRDHARRVDLGHQLVIGDMKVLHQTRRNGTTARFDPALAVQQRNSVTRPDKILGSCST